MQRSCATRSGNTFEEGGVMDKHECAPENAAKMREWIRSRGGVAIWRSQNLSNPGASWSSPALTPEGTPYPKPSWQAENAPHRIITAAAEIEVITRKEVKRFRIAVRMGGSGLTMKLTDASTRKVRAACDKLGPDSAYEFDYGSQEAIITLPGERVSLADWTEPTLTTEAKP